MSKKDLSYLFGILLGLVFLSSGIKEIYIKKIYNLIFLCLGLFLVLLNIYLLLNKKDNTA
ncbi:MAG: hypothetical protein PUG67_03680 [Peptoniphilaceae bacterium]|nr:hypothetical protein [Peptoniphilaceae bacterium]MDY6019530.1 hypothetical protein [Anaerococcus sp.]